MTSCSWWFRAFPGRERRGDGVPPVLELDLVDVDDVRGTLGGRAVLEGRALGLDGLGRAGNRGALERARDTGEPAMSDRLMLLRADGGLGFVIFVPVYRGGGVPGTVEERRRDLEGFVSASFRPALMLRGLFGSSLGEPVDL